MRKLDQALWTRLPTRIDKPTDIGAYKEAIKTIVESSNGVVNILDRRVSEVESPSTTTAGVTRVGLTMPSDVFAVDTPIITRTGTFGVTLNKQSANRVFAGPVAPVQSAETAIAYLDTASSISVTIGPYSGSGETVSSPLVGHVRLTITVTVPTKIENIFLGLRGTYTGSGTAPSYNARLTHVGTGTGYEFFTPLAVYLGPNLQIPEVEQTNNGVGPPPEYLILGGVLSQYGTKLPTLTAGTWKLDLYGFTQALIDAIRNPADWNSVRFEATVYLTGATADFPTGQFDVQCDLGATGTAQGTYVGDQPVDAGAVPAFRLLVDPDIPSTIVRTSRRVNTSSPLAGGGALTSDLTLSIPRANAGTDGYLDNDDWTTFNSKVSPSRQVNTTSPLTGGGSLASDLTLGITQVSASTDGYLSQADYSTFVGYGTTITSIQTELATKVPNTRQVNTTAPLAGGGALSSDLTLSMPEATGLQDGYLSAVAFNTFSNKVPSTRQVNTTLPLLGGGSLSGDLTLSMPQASAVQNGYLSFTDWVRFNSAVAGGPDPDLYYIHDQAVASDTWEINHGLSRVPTGILVVRSDGEVTEGEVTVVDQAANNYYTHTQAVSASTWVIDHGLGAVVTGVTLLVDGEGYVDAELEVDQTSPYQVRALFSGVKTGKAFVSTGSDAYPLTIRFASAIAGKAYISIGSDQPPYHHAQAVAASDWVVSHGLGRVPTQMKVFDSVGQVVEPQVTVSETDPYTVHFLFGTPVTGDAWLT